MFECLHAELQERVLEIFRNTLVTILGRHRGKQTMVWDGKCMLQIFMVCVGEVADFLQSGVNQE